MDTQKPKIYTMAYFLRQHYLGGEQIQLHDLSKPDPRLTKGDTGTLLYIDNNCGIHVKWDKGFETVVTPGADDFRIKAPKLETMKLYMPLCAEWADGDDTYDVEEASPLSDREILNYQDAIENALLRYREPIEAERGIMHWYDEDDAVDVKVKSAVFTTEARDGKLWGVAECRVAGKLTADELTTLKDYISGQASDGWGEGFEQREIETGDGDIYVHLWDWENWDIQTEEELFAPKVADGLPPLCFSTLPTTGELICIKRGESGYYPSDWSTSNPAANKELADFNNQKLGVTFAQRMAMECGSMHGWDVPGANPAAYPDEPIPEQASDPGMTMGGM